MSHSASVKPDSSSPKQIRPIVLEAIPDLPVSAPGCSARIGRKIDLMLLAIEALQLGGSEQMLAAAKELELQEIVKNRVVLWRLRCTNSWRRSYTRNTLKLDEAKALVAIASLMAKRLTVLIRQLLLAQQQLKEKGQPLENHFRLAEYLERFRTHFRSRMNSRRAKVAIYLTSDDQINELALSLLSQLLFCTGTLGMQRFWASLFDGEVT